MNEMHTEVGAVTADAEFDPKAESGRWIYLPENLGDVKEEES